MRPFKARCTKKVFLFLGPIPVSLLFQIFVPPAAFLMHLSTPVFKIYDFVLAGLGSYSATTVKVQSTRFGDQLDCHPEAWLSTRLGYLQEMYTTWEPPGVSQNSPQVADLPLVEGLPSRPFTRMHSKQVQGPSAYCFRSFDPRASSLMPCHPSLDTPVLPSSWLLKCETRSSLDNIVSTMTSDHIIVAMVLDTIISFVIHLVVLLVATPLIWLQKTFGALVYYKGYTFPILF